MNKDRRILLIILFFSILASLTFINIFTLNEKRSGIRSGIENLEMQYLKLGSRTGEISEDDIDTLKELIEKEQLRYFQSENTDPYRFGLDIKDLLESNSLYVREYKTIEQDNAFLIEFSVEGSSRKFFTFLEDIYKREKNYRFPYFSVKNEKEGISSTFRIGYAFYE